MARWSIATQSGEPTIDSARALAARADSEPAAVAAEAAAALSERSEQDWDLADAITAWALGLALRHLRRLPEAKRWLSAAITHFVIGDDDHTSVGLSLAGAHILAGEFHEANEVLATTRPSPALAGRVQFQSAGVATRLGDMEQAWEGFTHALSSFEATGDSLGEAMAQSELGVILVRRGQAEEALTRFGLAHARYRDLGIELYAVLARHNIALAASRAGLLGVAIREFEAAHERLRDLGGPYAEVALDQVEAMLMLGAEQHAVAIAHEALESLEAGEADTDRAEMLVGLGRALGMCGHHQLAGQAFDLAADLFGRHGRQAWCDVVRFHRQELASASDVARTAALGDTLRACGFRDLAADADLAEILEVLSQGLTPDDRTVARLLGLPAGDDRRRSAVQALALAARDYDTALAEGLAILRSPERGYHGVHQLSVRASQLARRRQALSMGGAAAQASNRPHHLIALVAAAQGALTRPISDARAAAGSPLAAAVENPNTTAAQWRSLLDSIERSERPGETSDEHPWHRGGRRVTLPSPSLTILDDGVHLWMATEGPHAIQFADGASRPVVMRSMERLARLLVDVMHEPTDTAERALAQAREVCLDAMPWAREWPGTQTVTLLASGPLASAPWMAVLQRPVRTILGPPQLTSTRTVKEGLALVVGPGVKLADEEVEAVTRARPQVTCLPVGSAAEVSAVGSVEVLHLCCHGHHDPDTPLLSSYELHGGPLTGLDIAAMAEVPRIVVSAACRAAQLGSAAGWVSAGLSTAWIAAGADLVIAPCLPVPDSAVTAHLMGEVHRALAEGIDPAEAVFWVGGAVDSRIASSMVVATRRQETPWSGA